MPVAVRPAAESDLPALARLDLAYPTDRVLALDRSGAAPEHGFAFRWRSRGPGTAVAYEYSEHGLRGYLSRAGLFLVAEVDGEIAGLLIVLLPSFTDAGEITDLAVHRPLRRRGAGLALVDAALEFARALGLGATLTTVYRTHEAEVKQLLGIPDGVETMALIPIGYPVGKFGPTMRIPTQNVVYWDKWGQAGER